MTEADDPFEPRDACECCGALAVHNNCYPYGTYCGPCGDDVCHPTGFGFCYQPGDQHTARKPVDFVYHEEGL